MWLLMWLCVSDFSGTCQIYIKYLFIYYEERTHFGKLGMQAEKIRLPDKSSCLSSGSQDGLRIMWAKAEMWLHHSCGSGGLMSWGHSQTKSWTPRVKWRWVSVIKERTWGCGRKQRAVEMITGPEWRSCPSLHPSLALHAFSLLFWKWMPMPFEGFLHSCCRSWHRIY